MADLELVARPYNRFKSDRTVWWLVKSSEWPAYRQGKIFFDMRKKLTVSEGKIFCGFTVEKGLGEEWKVGCDSKNHSVLLEKDWLWYEFWKQIGEEDSLFLRTLDQYVTLTARSMYSFGNFHLFLQRHGSPRGQVFRFSNGTHG